MCSWRGLENSSISNVPTFQPESKSYQRMWTCFKDHKKFFSNNYLPNRNFVACNTRSTNEFRNKISIAYTINKYVDPFYVAFFSKRKIKLNRSSKMKILFVSNILNNKAIKSMRRKKLIKKGNHVNLYIGRYYSVATKRKLSGPGYDRITTYCCDKIVATWL